MAPFLSFCLINNQPQQPQETAMQINTNYLDNLRQEALASDTETTIIGKDLPLEQTIANMIAILQNLGMKIEIASWRNIVPNVWSVHIRDADSPMCFTNGKGTSKESALASALGEFVERLNCNFFYNDQFFGVDIANAEFVHYPNEKWFPLTADDSLPQGLLDDYTLAIYNPDDELQGSHLIDTNSGNATRGICALPFVRQSDGETVYFPSNLIENLFLSNGMSAGNNLAEAKVQCLSEIFERAVKRDIIENATILPNVPTDIIAQYPKIAEGIHALEEQGFPILVKDASLGGKFPVMCVTLMNPKTGGVFASFGAHPSFEVALERSLTELLQGRSFEGLNDLPKPTFSDLAVSQPENFVEHFIDSTGVISWHFFSNQSDYEFVHWDFSSLANGKNSEESDYLFALLAEMGKEVYVAEYSDIGYACRILVPNYSEVYPVEDLIYDNTNKALAFREDILNIHRLTEEQLAELLGRLEQLEVDHYSLIKTLIGIEFDANTVWSKLTILELKLLLCLALGDVEEANELTGEFLQFNDNTVARNLFYQAMQASLHICLDESLNYEDYYDNFCRMFGKDVIDAVVGSINGEIKFYGLIATNMKLEGLERHQNLLESYQKLHGARGRLA